MGNVVLVNHILPRLCPSWQLELCSMNFLSRGYYLAVDACLGKTDATENQEGVGFGRIAAQSWCQRAFFYVVLKR